MQSKKGHLLKHSAESRTIKESSPAAKELQDSIATIVQEVGRIILGKEKQVRLALTCLLAQGHLLIEDLPGIGKTTMAKTLAYTMGLHFERIQFTSDLLPGDILGVSVYDQHKAEFSFHSGPIFTQVLLADEINRATPKTQSALLEAMEEEQVTIEGQTRPLPRPFYVIATQNPQEQAGTYPLPESQLDRFLLRIKLGYPHREAEKQLLQAEKRSDLLQTIKPRLEAQNIQSLQAGVTRVHVSEALIEYVQDILQFTREGNIFQTGLSPRAGLALLRSAQSWAFIHGRNYVLPEDVQEILPGVVVHRLSLVEEDMHDEQKSAELILRSVAVP
jgi:MoxR-like ATPase